MPGSGPWYRAAASGIGAALAAIRNGAGVVFMTGSEILDWIPGGTS